MLEEPEARQPQSLDIPTFGDDNTEEFVSEPDVISSSPQRRRLITIIAVVVILAIVTGLVLHGRSQGSTTPITYQYGKLAQGNLALTVAATGPLQSAIYNVNFASSGKIAQIFVKVGQIVHAGDQLAQLDPTSLQDAMNQAQAQVNSAKTQLSQSQSNYNHQATVDNAQKATAYDQEQNALFSCQQQQNPAPSCQQLAQDQYASTLAQLDSSLTSAQGQINTSNTQLQTAQTQMQTAQDNLNSATLTAPHDGTIAAINGLVGSPPGGSSSDSSSSGSTFIQIADLSAMEVDAAVNEADISGLASGDAVTFTVSAYKSRVFRGTVSDVSPIGQSSSNVVTYPVTISVDMTRLQGSSLLPGMTANMTITTAERTNALLLPATAVTFATNAANPNSYNLVSRTDAAQALTAARKLQTDYQTANPTSTATTTLGIVAENTNNTWMLKPVLLGLTNGSIYEVLSGLTAGETVAIGRQGGSGSSTSGSSTSTTRRGEGGLGGGFGGGFGGGGFGGGTGGGRNP